MLIVIPELTSHVNANPAMGTEDPPYTIWSDVILNTQLRSIPTDAGKTIYLSVTSDFSCRDYSRFVLNHDYDISYVLDLSDIVSQHI